MAVVEWLEVVSGGDNDLANTTNYSTGALPALNDTLLFTGGSRSVALNPTALSSTQLTSVQITQGYAGALGSEGGPIVVDAATLDYDGRGTAAYFKGDYTNVFVRNTGPGRLHLENGSDLNDELGTLHIGPQAKTTIMSPTAAVVDDVYVWGELHIKASLTVNAGKSVVIGSGGLLISEVSLPAITVGSGELRLQEGAAASGTITLHDGATLDLRHDGTGTISKIVNYCKTGGGIKLDKLTDPITITNYTKVKNAIDNGIENHPLVTITNAVVVIDV